MAAQSPLSPDGDLPQTDVQECWRLRRLLRSPTELIWNQSSAFWHAFARSVASRKQYKASAVGDTSTIPDEVANRVIQRLMTWKDEPAGPSLTHLAAAICRGRRLVLARTGDDPGQIVANPDQMKMVRQALSLDDPQLVVALRAYVYYATSGSLRQVAGGRSPEKQRIRRALRRHIHKSTNLHLVHEFSRGVFVCTPQSDFALPPVKRDRLADYLPPSGKGFASILKIMGRTLKPEKNSGGYFYLQELVEVCFERFQAGWVSENNGGRPQPEPIDPMVARMALQRCSLMLEEILERLGQEILRRNRPGDIGVRPDIRSSWKDVVLIYFAQLMKVSDPEWDGASVRTIAMTLIPNVDREVYRRWHQGRIEYLIRRTRDEMMRRHRVRDSLAAH